MTSQILTFLIGDATYGIDIHCVQEIRGWSAVTRLPQAPTEVLGVLNLRGAIVPVLDLRLKFGCTDPQYTPLTVIVVVSVPSAKSSREVGMVVDGVTDVMEIAAPDVKSAPELGTAAGHSWVRGLVTIAAGIVILLDIDLLVGRGLPTTGSDDSTQAA